MNMFDFRGPLFAFSGRLRGGEEDSADIVKAYDMDMLSQAHLVAFLSYYYNKDDAYHVLVGPKFKGVKFTCSGDRVKGTPSHQEVLVPRTHPIFIGKGTPSEISEVSIHPGSEHAPTPF